MYREEMSAEQYTINHWLRKAIWKHIRYARHQKRVRKCVYYLIGSRFMDIGCAVGHGTDFMKKLRPGEWAGLDLSETAIRKAKRVFS